MAELDGESVCLPLQLRNCFLALFISPSPQVVDIFDGQNLKDL